MTTVKSPFGGDARWLGKPLNTVTSRMVTSLKGLTAAILDMSPDAITKAWDRFEDEILEVLVVSNLTGRMHALRRADRVPPPPSKFAVSETDDGGEEFEIKVAAVPFREAIENIVTREPRLAESAAEVAELYAREHVFALARSTDIALTRKIRDVMASALEKGFDPSDHGRVIAEMGEWTQAYGETVFRTNAATAFTAGKFEQVQDPDVADLIPAFEYNAVRDSSVRHNHLAADGLVAGTKDPIWKIFAPPLGYNCRCSLRYVDRYELEERHLLDASGRVIRHTPPNFSRAYPDPGFKR